MSHIEALIINELRKTLKKLEKEGVGYIDMETTGNFYYTFDNRKVRISVNDVTNE